VCEICGGSRHVYTGDGWARCVCLTEEIAKKQLGIFYTATPAKKTELSRLVSKDVIIEASLAEARPHVARAILDLQESGKSVLAMDCYSLLEILLDKDEEFTTTAQVAQHDLLILLMGFGEPRNRYLPDLILQILGRREILRLPTWILLGIDRTSVAGKYGADVAQKLSSFRKARMR
jgi:hypothetical protein